MTAAFGGMQRLHLHCCEQLVGQLQLALVEIICPCQVDRNPLLQCLQSSGLVLDAPQRLLFGIPALKPPS
jgi:hypothetical protein